MASSQKLSVTSIDYSSKILQVNDPENCMPRRFLVDFSFDFPFKLDSRTEYRSFTFFNCSPTNDTELYNIYYFRRFSCLSGDNYTAGVLVSDVDDPPTACRAIKTVPVPFRNGWYGSNGSGFYEGVSLTWEEPYCGSCAREGGDCGFKSGSGLEIGCSGTRGYHSKKGLSKLAKLGIIMGTIMGAILICVVAFHFSGNSPYRRRPNADQESIARPVLPVVTVRLSRSVIESYPKHVIGESDSEVPTSFDNGDNVVCSICLCEYKVKEEVRMILDCKNFFHVDCVDEWLLKNATCPLCRQSGASSPPSLVAPLSPSPTATR